MIHKLGLVFIFFVLTFPLTTNAQDFVGQAIHKDEQEAKRQAITDLQQNIYVNVESQSETFQSNQGDDLFKFTSKLSSTLPILGASTDCFAAYDITQCQATLNSKNSALMYQAAIQQKQKTIEAQWTKTKNISSVKTKYDELSKLLKLIHETQQLALVLSIISPQTNILNSPVNSADISEAMRSLEQVANGLPMAALLISKKITNKSHILVKPFTPYDSSEITPFSTALQTQISNQVNAVLDVSNAKYTLQGKYQITDKHINVEAQLVDNNGVITNADVISIDKKSVSSFDHQPKQLDFERLLFSGQIVGQSFTTKITSNKGQRDLLFRQGETIKLLVKVSKPSYFYIVGHSNNTDVKLSYLLDLNDAPGHDKFISYLGMDEVNKWVVIGEFEAKKPFGSESVQVFASTGKPIDLLPATQFDGVYHVISGKRETTVTKTRGLVKKKQKTNVDGSKKVEFSEAVLSLTTAK
jgi:hypothetical protein